MNLPTPLDTLLLASEADATDAVIAVLLARDLVCVAVTLVLALLVTVLEEESNRDAEGRTIFCCFCGFSGGGGAEVGVGAFVSSSSEDEP